MSKFTSMLGRVKVKKPEPEEEPDENLEIFVKGSPAEQIENIQKFPVPKGEVKKLIVGEPIDWHDLEDFVVSISPHSFITFIKLHEQKVREEVSAYLPGGGPRKPMSKALMWIIVAIILAGLGIFFIMFMPQIMQMFQGQAQGLT